MFTAFTPRYLDRLMTGRKHVIINLPFAIYPCCLEVSIYLLFVYSIWYMHLLVRVPTCSYDRQGAAHLDFLSSRFSRDSNSHGLNG